MNFKYTHIILTLVASVFFGCGPFKYIPESKNHLNNVEVQLRKNSELKEQLYQNISPKPNKRFMGLKFHMFIYDLSNPNKNNKINNWLRKIGEQPVIWDEYQSNKSKERLYKYLYQNGYFMASISDSVSFQGRKNRKLNVYYKVLPKEAYKIKKIAYQIEDTLLKPLIIADTINRSLKLNDRYDVASLIEEKKRLKNLLLENGYYGFNDEDINNYISFRVDTSLKKNVGIEIFVKNPPLRPEHQLYRINKVYVFRNYNPKAHLADKKYFSSNIDTVEFSGIGFLSKGKVSVKPDILAQSNYIYSGDLFNQQNEYLTMKHLRSLRIFQNVEIEYDILKDTVTPFNERLMNTYINLTPMNRQLMQYEISATNSSVSSDDDNKNIIGDIGGEASIKYQYKNLFGNAEILDVTFRGMGESFFYKSSKVSKESKRVTASSLGLEVRLNIPRFLVPFKSENFIKKFSPQTSTALSYKFFERDSAYLQRSVNLSFGYNWRGNKYTRHWLDLVNLNYVNIGSDSVNYPYFEDYIGNIGAQDFESFQNKMISSIQYSFEYNSEGKAKRKDFIYFRTNFEFAGNVLIAAYDALGLQEGEGQYNLFGVPISQFAKIDVDFRYYDQKSNSQSIVYRIFLGVAKPYGKSESVPFEKKYFIGGPNSVRAWNPYNLGPGRSWSEPRYRLNGSSDLKLEFNLEYRFDLFWKLEGALFMDGGNIWSLSKNWERDELLKQQVAFDFKDLKTQIALGAGVGLRVDLEYFIFRIDWGLKIHNPASFYPEKYLDVTNNEDVKERWIFEKEYIDPDDWNYQMGVTYPF